MNYSKAKKPLSKKELANLKNIFTKPIDEVKNEPNNDKKTIKQN